MTHLYPSARTGFGVQRIPEYLENLKADFDSLTHDVNMYKMQRDDYERKRNVILFHFLFFIVQAQLTELSNIQQTLFDLERNHTKLKQQYVFNAESFLFLF